jgi:hypothetical protein
VNEQQIKMLMLSVLRNIIMSTGCSMANAMKQLTIVDGLVSTTVYTGGTDCNHQPNPGSDWYNAISNIPSWDWEVIKEGDRVKSHSNRFHIGCQLDYDIERINDALWVVEWQVNRLPKITISNKISENEINLLTNKLQEQFGRVVRAQTAS